MTLVPLRLEGVTVRRGARAVLEAVSTTAAPGELIGLIGPNGAGKTTLLRAAMGLLPIGAGHVRILDRALSDWNRRRLGRVLAYLPQSGGEAWPIRVDRFVALGRLPHLEPWRGPGVDDAKAIDAAMAATDIGAYAARAVTELSDGERARVHLARALAVEAPIIGFMSWRCCAPRPTIAIGPSSWSFTTSPWRIGSAIAWSCLMVAGSAPTGRPGRC